MFSAHGVRSRVCLAEPPQAFQDNLPVLVIDTETRHLPEAEAAQIVLELAQQSPALLKYKKTDSTLRGNVYAELSALSGLGPLMYAPAYPKLGRTVEDGCLLLDGIPVEQTCFAADPHHPVTDGNIIRLLRGNKSIQLEIANTEEAMHEVALRWIAQGGFAAGPCGLLDSAAAILGNGIRAPLPPVNACRALVVSGSRHPVSREQVSKARSLFEAGNWVLIEAESDLQPRPKEYAGEFGRIAAGLFQSGSFDALVVFGGDTAFAVLQALGVKSLETLGGLAPGVPISKMPDGGILISKAGGFGPPNLLLQMQEQLHGK